MFQLPFPLRDANAGSGPDSLGNLPEWDLTDLYTAVDAPELARDLDWLEQECSAFAADYEGKLANLDAKGLLDCVLRNEKINYKVREHSLGKVPVILACGMKEVEERTVSTRRLGEKQTKVQTLDEIVTQLTKEATPPDLL